MRILLLGANGQVGHELRRSLLPLGEVLAATRSGTLEPGVACESVDFDQPDALRGLVERVAADVVVNAAAYTAVDRAEDEPGLAFRVNAEAPAALAQACAAHGALFVHYSTDYVFNGQSTRPYRENDTTGPLGVYGASKLAGEEGVRAAAGRHMIFRTAWVYGRYGHNFMQTMLRLGAEREQLQVVADQIGAPTPARLIADITTQALRAQPVESGVWHLTASGETSWHGFAQEIFDQAFSLGMLARKPVVTPISTEQYPTRARRPAYSCLDVSRLQDQFGVDIPDWRVALRKVLVDGAMLE